MTTKNYALTINPLSSKFKTQLENKLGAPINFLLLGTIRSFTLKQIWRYLRSLDVENLLLPIEYDNFKLLIPILELVTIPISAKKISIVHSDLTFSPINKLKIVAQTIPISIHLFKAYVSCVQNLIDVRKYLKKAPTYFKHNDSRRVLYLDNTIWFGPMAGGCVAHVSGVVNALLNKGYGVDYAALQRLPPLLPQVNFHKIISPKLFVLPGAVNLFPLNDAVISQLIKKPSNYQFIYQRLVLNNYAGVKLSQKLNIPLILEYNSPLVWVAKVWGTQQRLRFEKYAENCENICLKHAHLIVTISEVLRDHLINKGISPNKIAYYPNGIDPEIFNPERFTQNNKIILCKQYDIPENALIFCFIGTFGPWHGVTILAHAIKKLIDEHFDCVEKYTVRFLLIGNGVEYSNVKSILNKPLYQRHVIFTDVIPQEAAPEYLAISDVFLSPQVPNPDGSRFFGSPTKLFEYMGMAKPIIASKLEQIGDILKNSLDIDRLPSLPPNPDSPELALLCEPGNIDQLVKAMIFLCEQPEWRCMLGKNARKEALSKFTWDKNVSHFLDKLTAITQ